MVSNPKTKAKVVAKKTSKKAATSFSPIMGESATATEGAAELGKAKPKAKRNNEEEKKEDLVGKAISKFKPDPKIPDPIIPDAQPTILGKSALEGIPMEANGSLLPNLPLSEGEATEDEKIPEEKEKKKDEVDNDEPGEKEMTPAETELSKTSEQLTIYQGAKVEMGVRETESDDLYGALKAKQEAKVSGRILNNFINNTANKAQTVVTMANSAINPLQVDLDLNKQKIEQSKNAKLKNTELHFTNLRAKADKEAKSAIGSISGNYNRAVTKIKNEIKSKKDLINKAHAKLVSDIGDAENKYFSDKLEPLYEAKGKATREKGKEVGQYAKREAEKKAKAYLAKKIHRDDSLLDGPLTDNRMDARAKAARETGKGYVDAMKEQGESIAVDVEASMADDMQVVSEQVTQQMLKTAQASLQTNMDTLDVLQKKSIQQAKKTKNDLIKSVKTSLKALKDSYQQQESNTKQNITITAADESANMEKNTMKVGEELQLGVNNGLNGLLTLLQQLSDPLQWKTAPEAKSFDQKIQKAKADVSGTLTNTVSALNLGIENLKSNAQQHVAQVELSLNEMVQNVVTASVEMDQQQTANLEQIKQNSAQTFNQLVSSKLKQVDQVRAGAQQVFDGHLKDLNDAFLKAYEGSDKSLDASIASIDESLRKPVNENMPEEIKTAAEEAAAKVKPRWKKVLMVLAIIIVIVLIIVVMVATGGAALGPLLVAMAKGALIGGILGGVIKMGMNIIDGKDLFDGVVEAVIQGAIAGAATAGLVFLATAAAGVALGAGATVGTTGLTGWSAFFAEVGIETSVDIVWELLQGNDLTWKGVGLSLGLSVLGSSAVLKGAKQGFQSTKKSIQNSLGDSFNQNIKKNLKESFEKNVKEIAEDNLKKQTVNNLESAAANETKKEIKDEVGDGLKKVDDGGVKKVDDGGGKKVDDGAKKVDDGGGKKVDDGAKKVDDGGGKKVDDGTKKVDDSAKKVDDSGGKKVDDGAKKVDDGGGKKVDDSAKKVDDGAKKVDDGPKKVDEDAKKIDDANKPKEDGKVDDGSKPKEDGKVDDGVDNAINKEIKETVEEKAAREARELAEKEAQDIIDAPKTEKPSPRTEELMNQHKAPQPPDGYHYAEVNGILQIRRNAGLKGELPELILKTNPKTGNVEIAPKPPKSLDSNKIKGLKGELNMDEALIDTHGATKLNNGGKKTDIDGDAHGTGLDGVYEMPLHKQPPKFIVAEAKFGSAGMGTSKDGRQMSSDWISARLYAEFGKKKAREILKDYEPIVVRTKESGEITFKKVDESGYISDIFNFN